VRLDKPVVPQGPVLVGRVAKYYGGGWVPNAGSSFQVGSEKPVLIPGQGFAKKSSPVFTVNKALAVLSLSIASLIFIMALMGKLSRIALMVE
jgi:hypothetical protein